MKNFWRKNNKELFVAFIIVIGSIFLRIYNLNSVPIFGDEAIYIRWAQVMRAEPSLRFLPLTDGKQPLFMWMVIPLLKIINDPLIAGRLVSVITGIGSLIGVFVLSFVLFGSYRLDQRFKLRLSLLASFIYAISPFSIFFDRLALADSMLAFFGIWTLIFSIITVRNLRLDTAMLAGFSLGGALLTKSPAMFFSLLAPVSFLLSKWPKMFKARFNKISVYLFLFTFTYLIAYAMYNILRLGTNFHMIGIRNKDYIYPISHILDKPFNPFLVFLNDIFNYFWLLGPSVLVFLILLGIYIGWKNYRKETLLLLAWGILPIVLTAEFSKTMTARYIYFSIPYLFILASLSLGAKLIHPQGGMNLNEIVKGSKPINPTGRQTSLPRLTVAGWIGSNLRGITRIGFIILVMHSLFVDFQLVTNPQAAKLPRSERTGYLEEWTAGYGIKEAAEYLKEQSKNLPTGRQVVVGTEGYFGTLPDGLQIYLNNHPNITVIGVGIDLKELPKSLKESKAFGSKTYLVINNSRLKAEPQDMGLEIVAAYPKALRLEGTKEYNLNGPQEVLYLFEVVK
ncbi:hypothetical protein A2863_04715 [Candidatus Woesebacteria bacterium RIFCSPHIGHO2_01_FULL_38_9b]|uniref:ArnT-like N-terminal domain-containing protein n=1 Tax=Candidatus Woesebacteria bacterium RIFCSPHIGHO2_01_FULL_38_9b TaxID=1802493 RepID=A0A1F7Y5L1_9BACT|nr:MAG: hypothetical protein A2863_04715 [Candidatus Woesebacteria bacterium RIFCSPHIGHO2_01_FULL_38_9b]